MLGPADPEYQDELLCVEFCLGGVEDDADASAEDALDCIRTCEVCAGRPVCLQCDREITVVVAVRVRFEN